MDKQIIYNCPHISFTDWGTYACKLYNPRDKNCLVKGGNCVSNISCPYKQFKRKEQECEGLKEEIKKHNDDMFKNPPEKRFYCKGCTLPYISKKLKQTLTEIKEIAENFYLDGEHVKDKYLAQEILQKISEVENEKR